MPRDPTRTVRGAQGSSQRNGYALPHRRPVRKQPDRCSFGKVRRIQKERNEIAKRRSSPLIMSLSDSLSIPQPMPIISHFLQDLLIWKRFHF